MVSKNWWAVMFAQATDRSLSPTNIFAPASTPARSIFELSTLVLWITAAIFIVVFSLLAYCVVKFRSKGHDDGREPAQVYGSNQVELAWTVIPVLIVLVLFLATAQVINAVQNAPRPKGAIEVTAVTSSGGNTGFRIWTSLPQMNCTYL